MQLPGLHGETEHALQDGQLAIDLTGGYRVTLFRQNSVCAFARPAAPNNDILSPSLGAVRSYVARADRRHAAIAEERPQVLVDSPRHVDDRLAFVDLVIVEQIRRGFVERDLADLR
ncbi:MAG TPA: hypothetical protein VEA16_20750, partial [Vicinamibacterales bacterium]|nr:hypothetical protein [Vicinamibacterales bacterium]